MGEVLNNGSGQGAVAEDIFRFPPTDFGEMVQLGAHARRAQGPRLGKPRLGRVVGRTKPTIVGVVLIRDGVPNRPIDLAKLPEDGEGGVFFMRPLTPALSPNSLKGLGRGRSAERRGG